MRNLDPRHALSRRLGMLVCAASICSVCAAEQPNQAARKVGATPASAAASVAAAKTLAGRAPGAENSSTTLKNAAKSNGERIGKDGKCFGVRPGPGNPPRDECDEAAARKLAAPSPKAAVK